MSATASDGPDGDLLATSAAGPAAVRGGVVRVAGYLLTVALSVLSAALLFRHLGVADGGRYVTVISLVALFAGLTEAGLASIAVRELARAGREDVRGFMRGLLGLRVALSLGAAVFAVGAAAALGYSAPMVAGTALVALAMVVQSFQLTLGAGLAAQLRFGWVAAIDVLRQAVNTLAIVLLVLAGAGLVPLLAALIPATVAALIATIALVRTRIPLRPSIDREVWKRLLREVAPFAAATAVAAVYFRVSLIIVSVVADERQTGYFGASFRVAEVLLGIPILAVGVAFPIFARAASTDLARLRFGVQRVLDVSALLGALVVVGVFVGAPVIIDVVAGEDFGPAVPVLRIQCLALFGSFLAAVWGHALLSLGRYRELLVLAFVPLMLNGVLTALLAPDHGAEGAAIATVFGELVLAAGGAYAFSRAAGRPALWRLFAAAGIAVPCAALAAIDGVPVVLLALGAGLAFLVLARVTRVLDADLVRDLRARRAS